MNRNLLLPLLGLGASLALVWSATGAILWNASRPMANNARYTSSERLMFYRVPPSRTLRLQLPAGTEAIRAVTHLVLPAGSQYAPEHQYLYGFRLRLTDLDGTTRLERTFFTRSRQSKAELIDGQWKLESAFTTDPDAQLADEREFLLDVPAEMRGRPGAIDLEYAGSSGELLVRPYARYEHRPFIVGNGSVGRRQLAAQRAERSTFVSWEKLSPETQRRLVEERWERLDAWGEPGANFLTEPVHRTGFQLPLVEVAEASQERLEPGRAVALNVAGPTRLVLWLWRAFPEPGGDPVGPVAVTALGPGGETRKWYLRVPAQEPIRQSIDVAAGLHTLSLFNSGGDRLRFTVEGPRFAWIAPDALKAAAAGPQTALVPHVRRMEAHVAGPGCEPIVLEIGEGRTELDRLFRVDARALDAHGGAPAQVRVTMLDGRHLSIGEAAFAAPTEPDFYEAADLPFRPRGRLPCAAQNEPVPATTVEVTDWPVPVSDASSARFLAPPNARRLMIRANRPTTVQLYGFLPPAGSAELARPYADHAPPALRWRYAPHDRSSWHALRPANHRSLAAAGAAISLLAQVRLEPSPAAADESGRLANPVAIAPAGTPASKQILEPDSTAGDPLRGVFTRLRPNEPVRLRFGARTPSRPELRVQTLDRSALGQDVRVAVNGRVVRRFRLRASRWRELLPPVEAGEHEVVLDTAAQVTATLNRAPAAIGTPALRERTVYRVADGPQVRVRKPEDGPVTLNIVLYSPSPQESLEPRVAISIDGGAPKRNAGLLVPRLTRSSREVPLPASERAAASPAGEPGTRWYARTVSVTLGDDLAPGAHWVRVTPVGPGPLWARFFVYGGTAPRQGPKQWTRPGWDVEDAP